MEGGRETERESAVDFTLVSLVQPPNKSSTVPINSSAAPIDKFDKVKGQRWV